MARSYVITSRGQRVRGPSEFYSHGDQESPYSPHSTTILKDPTTASPVKEDDPTPPRRGVVEIASMSWEEDGAGTVNADLATIHLQRNVSIRTEETERALILEEQTKKALTEAEAKRKKIEEQTRKLTHSPERSYEERLTVPRVEGAYSNNYQTLVQGLGEGLERQAERNHVSFSFGSQEEEGGDFELELEVEFGGSPVGGGVSSVPAPAAASPAAGASAAQSSSGPFWNQAHATGEEKRKSLGFLSSIDANLDAVLAKDEEDVVNKDHVAVQQEGDNPAAAAAGQELFTTSSPSNILLGTSFGPQKDLTLESVPTSSRAGAADDVLQDSPPRGGHEAPATAFASANSAELPSTTLPDQHGAHINRASLAGFSTAGAPQRISTRRRQFPRAGGGQMSSRSHSASQSLNSTLNSMNSITSINGDVIPLTELSSTAKLALLAKQAPFKANKVPHYARVPKNHVRKMKLKDTTPVQIERIPDVSGLRSRGESRSRETIIPVGLGGGAVEAGGGRAMGML